MQDWDSAQYVKFEEERTQPARDLAGAIPLTGAAKILDVGCGPGNSTRVLMDTFPGAAVLGADTSDNMLAAARVALPKATFVKCDIAGNVSALGGDYDIVFSNACLQWVPGHPKLIPRLLGLLRPGGVLAVQVPMQDRAHIHTIVGTAASQPPWSRHIPQEPLFHTLTEQAYIDLLTSLSPQYRVWKTVYYHIFDSHDIILEWYRGTGLRPYLHALPQEQRPAFEAHILEKVRAAYPQQQNGQVAFPFPRFFFVVQKPGKSMCPPLCPGALHLYKQQT